MNTETQYCTTCLCSTPWDDWEVGGADDGHVFCPVCSAHIDTETATKLDPGPLFHRDAADVIARMDLKRNAPPKPKLKRQLADEAKGAAIRAAIDERPHNDHLHRVFASRDLVARAVIRFGDRAGAEVSQT